MKPYYKVMDGWREDISECRTWDDLPENAKKYVEFIEEQIGMRIKYISVGKDRQDLIERDFDDDELDKAIENYYQATKRFVNAM